MGFFGYHLLDNLFLLASSKVIRFDADMFFVNGQRFRWCGLLCQLIKNYRKIKKSNYYMAQLKSKMLNYEPQEFDQIMNGLKEKRRKAILFFVKEFCDFMTASHYSGVLSLFRMEFNNLVLGLTGSISAGISLKMIFK